VMNRCSSSPVARVNPFAPAHVLNMNIHIHIDARRAAILPYSTSRSRARLGLTQRYGRCTLRVE